MDFSAPSALNFSFSWKQIHVNNYETSQTEWYFKLHMQLNCIQGLAHDSDLINYSNSAQPTVVVVVELSVGYTKTVGRLGLSFYRLQ